MAVYPLKSVLPIPQAASKKILKLAQDNRAVFKKDANFFWMRNFARFEVVRNWATRDNGSAQAFINNPLSDCLNADDSLETVKGLFQANGYYEGLHLSSDALKSLLNFARTNPCYADRNPSLKFYVDQRQDFETKLGRTIKLAGYMDAHETCGVFQQLKQDPLILAIAASYLGREPKYHRGEIAWSFPGTPSEAEKLAAAQVIHCDINDYKTVKFFFYLTDVDGTAGPHAYLRGSHKNRKLMHQLMGQRCASIPDSTLVERYGEENLREVHAKAGFGFVGDPYTFHKGMTPTEKPRLLLQLEFGVNRYKTWYFDSNPS
jgi:hypothetical protein